MLKRWINRLFALRAMEARGLIDETLRSNPEYEGISEALFVLRQTQPDRAAGPDAGWRAVVEDACRAQAAALPGLFDLDDPGAALRPSVPALLRAVERLSGRARERSIPGANGEEGDEAVDQGLAPPAEGRAEAREAGVGLGPPVVLGAMGDLARTPARGYPGGPQRPLGGVVVGWDFGLVQEAEQAAAIVVAPQLVEQPLVVGIGQLAIPAAGGSSGRPAPAPARPNSAPARPQDGCARCRVARGPAAPLRRHGAAKRLQSAGRRDEPAGGGAVSRRAGECSAGAGGATGGTRRGGARPGRRGTGRGRRRYTVPDPGAPAPGRNSSAGVRRNNLRGGRTTSPRSGGGPIRQSSSI